MDENHKKKVREGIEHNIKNAKNSTFRYQNKKDKSIIEILSSERIMNQERTIRSYATLIITETYSGGYQRYKACQELERKPNFQVKFFEDPLLEQKFRIKTDVNRRHLTLFRE